MTPPPLTRAEVQEWYPTSDPDTHNSDHLLRQRVLALLDRCERAEADMDGLRSLLGKEQQAHKTWRGKAEAHLPVLAAVRADLAEARAFGDRECAQRMAAQVELARAAKERDEALLRHDESRCPLFAYREAHRAIREALGIAECGESGRTGDVSTLDTVEEVVAQLDAARAELDDMRRAWAILDEPGAELRHAHTATEAAQQFVARLAEARATSQLHAEAAARALARESVLREALAVVETRFRKHREGWEHDHDDDADDCRACEYDALWRRCVAALASPDTAAAQRDERLRAEGATAEREKLCGTFVRLLGGPPGAFVLDDMLAEHDAKVRAAALEEAAAWVDAQFPDSDWERTDFVRGLRTLAATRHEAKDVSQQVADALERSKPLVREALKLGRSISRADPTLAGVRIGSHEATDAKCETCGGSRQVDSPMSANGIAPCPSCTGPAVKP